MLWCTLLLLVYPTTSDEFLIRFNIMENLKKIRLKIFNLTEFCHKANISSNNFVNWALQNYSDT